jgi:hypothetical protein
VTGQKSPKEQKDEAENVVEAALQQLDSGSDDKRERRRLLRHRRHELEAALERDPYLLVDALNDDRGGCSRIPESHWMLYFGVMGSLLLWAYALMVGIHGGASSPPTVSLAQANCESNLSDSTVCLGLT